MEARRQLLAVVAMVCTQCLGQSDSTARFAAVSGFYGFIIPHSIDVRDVADSYPWGVQAEYARQRFSAKAWDACNCYSKVGIAFSFADFGNPDVLGKSYSTAVFVEPQLARGKLALGLRASVGASYVTKIFDPDSNSENLFFSRKLNGQLSVGLNLQAKLYQRWIIGTLINYNHISNGGAQQPNKGMNFPVAGMGITYALQDASPMPRSVDRDYKKEWQYHVGLFAASRSVDNFGVSERKMMTGIYLGALRTLAKMHGAGLALESSHDSMLREKAIQGAPFEPWIVSVLARHHLLFGKFDFNQAVGYYLYERYFNRHAVFQRYALQYRVAERFQVGFSLKAHLEVAEQMDLRLIYQL